MKDYTAKVVVSTGAGSAMGRAYALEAAARGATLAETVRRLPAGTRVPSAAFDVAHRDVVYGFWGVVHGTRAFLPQVLDGDFGAIVNMSSLFGLVGAPNAADYCAAKVPAAEPAAPSV